MQRIVRDPATLAEIAENLHRREITALERAELEARWVDVVGSKPAPLPCQVGGTKRKNGRRKGPQHKPGGIEKSARDLGKPVTNLRRSIKIASLSPDAKEAAKQHGLDNNQTQ
ncbi:hypothetical protein CQ054_07690 [Ochrobactrum sp. MYb29]|nr:hypothetical protein CWE02_19170 [Brucella pituitosa]PRA87058.1 hypothetical protein CQ054_07690 [Ochrobactrum sp. MYb29]